MGFRVSLERMTDTRLNGVRIAVLSCRRYQRRLNKCCGPVVLVAELRNVYIRRCTLR